MLAGSECFTFSPVMTRIPAPPRRAARFFPRRAFAALEPVYGVREVPARVQSVLTSTTRFVRNTLQIYFPVFVECALNFSWLTSARDAAARWIGIIPGERVAGESQRGNHSRPRGVANERRTIAPFRRKTSTRERGRDCPAIITHEIMTTI